MTNLFKVKTIQVDGFEGGENITYSYKLSDLETIENEEEVTQDDVQMADAVFLTYNNYENLGEIDKEEIETLIKFGIIKWD